VCLTATSNPQSLKIFNQNRESNASKLESGITWEKGLKNVRHAADIQYPKAVLPAKAFAKAQNRHPTLRKTDSENTAGSIAAV